MGSSAHEVLSSSSVAMDRRALRRMQTGAIAAAAALILICGLLALAAAAALVWFGTAAAWPLLWAAAAAEGIFAAYWALQYRRLNAQPERHMPHDADSRAVFDRFIFEQHSVSKYICIRDMLRKWFHGVPIEHIKRGNVADLLTYGFFYKSRQQLEAEGQGHLPDQLVRELEGAWGVQFGDGHNQELSFMAHLWQGVRCHYRPLAFYLGIEFLFLLKHVCMRGAGFTAHSREGFTYYTRGLGARQQPRAGGQQQARPSAPGGSGGCDQQQQQGGGASGAVEAGDGAGDPTPILFLHGVGLGLLPYITFILRLAATGSPVIALEVDHLGMRLTRDIAPADAIAGLVVRGVLDAHGLDTACVVGHSYGTFYASRLVQLHRHRVHSLCLIDPVCFCMFTGKLIENFVYRPLRGSGWTTWIIARDLHHATSVCRNFFWTLLNLWPDQLPVARAAGADGSSSSSSACCGSQGAAGAAAASDAATADAGAGAATAAVGGTLVVVSGRDELVPVPEVTAMLEHESSAQVLFHPDHKHADFIRDFDWQDTIVTKLASMITPHRHHQHHRHHHEQQQQQDCEPLCGAACHVKVTGSTRQRHVPAPAPAPPRAPAASKQQHQQQHQQQHKQRQQAGGEEVPEEGERQQQGAEEGEGQQGARGAQQHSRSDSASSMPDGVPYRLRPRPPRVQA